MDLLKETPFFHPFIFGNIGQQSVFYDSLERKNACLGDKYKRFKNSENWDFSKGVSPWFWSKTGHFPFFLILRNIGQQSVFYICPVRKNASVGYKNRKFKKTENWDFSKGVSPWFWSKIGNFSIFLFNAI